MRSIALVMLTTGLALSGCGGSEKASEAAASGPVKREAGSWKTDLKLVKMDIPGMPPKMADGMKAMLEGASGAETCLTPEQAAKEDISKQMADQGSSGAKCEFSKNTLVGSKLDVVGKCTDPQGRAMDMAMTGTIAPKKTDVTMDITGPMPTGAGKMNMVMQVTSTHVGACKAG
jgi:hypothetical protein